MICTECDEVYTVRDKRQWRSEVCSNCRHVPPQQSIQISHRRCGKCKGPMAATRYFECHTCKPELPAEDAIDAYTFHNVTRRTAGSY